MERSGIDPDVEALHHWGHPPHAHAFGQFVTAVTGSGVLRIGERDYSFDAATAIWLPGGVEHSAVFAPDLLPLAIDLDGAALPTDVRRVSVETALRALTLAWARDDDAHRNADRESRIADAVRSSLSLRSPLRLPKGPLTRPVMEHLRRAPAVTPPLTEWATRLHASVPTIRRAFLAETGTTYSEWTTQFRLELSIDALHTGGTVAQVARAMGFSPNGYTLAFRRWMGQTPSEYRARVLA